MNRVNFVNDTNKHRSQVANVRNESLKAPGAQIQLSVAKGRNKPLEAKGADLRRQKEGSLQLGSLQLGLPSMNQKNQAQNMPPTTMRGGMCSRVMVGMFAAYSFDAKRRKRNLKPSYWQGYHKLPTEILATGN